MFFKSMSKHQHINWKKGAIVGFYTYMLFLFVDYSFVLFTAAKLFTSGFLFWSGLIAAFGYSGVLNLIDRRKIEKLPEEGSRH
ncbi:hypothetical protein [Halobacillus massiliensis]|uniref:hypothetical protein n=1 Tax=Halobacillus massiliensis TaxID=1926286 RepID=UPI001FE7805C|nr:hypothetical protein [Halobacillus massiliensis]